MLFPVKQGISRWETPDPEFDWIMVGHLLIADGRVVIVDPPFVPQLIEDIENVGDPAFIILTTADHTRGAKYLSQKLGVDLFIPKQKPARYLNPEKMLECKDISKFKYYDENTSFPTNLKPLRLSISGKGGSLLLDEMALLTHNNEIIVGDIASGGPDGKILSGEESFTKTPDKVYSKACFDVVNNMIISNNVESLIASHGHDILSLTN